MSGPELSVDAALALLRKETSSEERFRILTAVLSHWLGPGDPALGTPGSVEPRASGICLLLDRWFSIVGNREEIFDSQNSIVGIRPPDLAGPDQDGKVLIFAENQGVYHWSIEPGGEDPPVYGRYNENGVPWGVFSGSLSEFLIGVALHGLIHQAPYGGAASFVRQDVVDRIAKHLPEVALPPWTWPGDPSRFHGAGGAFMFAAAWPDESDGEPRAYSVFVGSPAAEPVAFLRGIVDDAWEHTSL